MTTVNVTRRHIHKDYFQERSGGYFNASGNGSGSSQLHIEPVRITELDAHEVIYVFPKPFPAGTIPVGLGNLTVCKYVADEFGGTTDLVRQDVLHSFPVNLSPHLQVLININPNEALEDIIIEGIFM